MTTSERFAANMKAAREAQGLTQAQFARCMKEAGLSQFHPTTVARIEKGERQVRLDEAPLIAKHLGVSLEQMMLGPEEFGNVLDYLQAIRGYRRSAGQVAAWLRRVAETQVEIQGLLDDLDREGPDHGLSTNQVSALRAAAGQALSEIVRVQIENLDLNDPWVPVTFPAESAPARMFPTPGRSSRSTPTGTSDGEHQETP